MEPETVGERIAELRRRAARKGPRVTQAYLADKIGIARGTVAAWEGNTQEPSGENLENLAKFFGVTPRYILTGYTTDVVGEQPGKDGAEPPPYDPELERAQLEQIGRVSDPLLRTMERDSLAAVIRAQGFREHALAARLEAETARERQKSVGTAVTQGAKEFERLERPQQPRKERKAG
jgi:transcriptional regulator with XRE-family HTH domain